MPELLWPWVFLLLPLPWLLRRSLPPAAQPESALRVSFAASLQPLASQRSSLQRWSRWWLPACIWLLLLTAAARPQLPASMPLEPDSGRELLLAVDISGSMDYPDMQWQGQPVSRLTLVQQLIGPFISQRLGDRVGLILFGSRAYLQSPLTRDRSTVRRWLQEARIGMAGRDTAIGDALGLAVKHLRNTPASQRVLLLITDGADSGSSLHPLTAARLAADSGLTVYSIGIAGPNAAHSSDAEVALDEPLLQEIARRTGGRYFRVSSQNELQEVAALLDRLQPALHPADLPQQGRPLYVWPLLLALLLSLWPAWPALRDLLARRLRRVA